MKLLPNHRTCPSSRLLICRRVLEEGWTLQEAAAAAGCSVRTAAKWLKRFREGDHELLDRPSRPRRSPTRLAKRARRGDRRPKAAMDDGGRDRRGARDDALHRLAVVAAARARPALAAAAAPPLTS